MMTPWTDEASVVILCLRWNMLLIKPQILLQYALRPPQLAIVLVAIPVVPCHQGLECVSVSG
jgi:hypothetical protein